MGAIKGLVVGRKEVESDQISPQERPERPFVRSALMHPGVMGKCAPFAGCTVIVYALAAQHLLPNLADMAQPKNR
jgi:hypothetical protein